MTDRANWRIPARTFAAARLVFLAGAALAARVHAGAGAASADAALESLLRQRTQELMDAVAPGKAEVWQRYLHPDAVSLDENGEISDRAKLLAELTPLPPGLVGTIEVDRFRMTREGGVAVVAAEIQEHLDYHGQNLGTRFRFLDTWVQSDGDWKLLARHTAAVLKDPPAVDLPAALLAEYSGRYRLTPEIETALRVDGDGKALVSERTGRPAARYVAELRDLFFAPGQPRTRRIFLRDAGGRVVAFVDRREGEDVRWSRVDGSAATAK